MVNVHIGTNNVHIFKAYDFERQSPQTYEESPLILVSLCSCSNPQFISKNSGSPYLLGTEKTLSLRLKPRCALPTIFIFPSVIKNLRSGRQTGVYRNFTRLVKFPNVNPALKNFSALIFVGCLKNRGEIFGGIATSVNPIRYTQLPRHYHNLKLSVRLVNSSEFFA